MGDKYKKYLQDTCRDVPRRTLVRYGITHATKDDDICETHSDNEIYEFNEDNEFFEANTDKNQDVQSNRGNRTPMEISDEDQSGEIDKSSSKMTDEDVIEIPIGENDDIEHTEIEIQEQNEFILENNLREILEDIEDNSVNDWLKKKPKNLQEFIDSEEFSKPINASVDKTVGELILMILLFSVSNSLSVSAIVNLFKLINSIFLESVLPDSRYFIDKIFNPNHGTEFHAVCHECGDYIGKFNEIDKSIEICEKCESPLDLKNPSNVSYFVLMDPSTQVAEMLHAQENYYDYVVNERQLEKGHFKDIYDGKMYRQFVKSLPKNDKKNYVTSIVNTDGAPKFVSSQYSIWPIFLKINELPPQIRMMNLVVCGLWFHKKKPEMCAFLEPFINLMRTVSEKGISCIIKGQERTVKLYTLVCCVDSVARAPIQGMKQFNGHFGCGWCLHSGVWGENSMKYPKLPEEILPREEADTLIAMQSATPDNPINGIKYPSPFINLPFFQIIRGFVPDYLHCCLEGVAAQFTEYYISSMRLDKDGMDELDNAMLNIALPHQLARLTRPLSARNIWKAREWENFVLYASIPIFSAKLKKKLWNHWILFVESLYILLQEDITIKEINDANEFLHQFVEKSQEYFNLKAMTFNLHLMEHLATSVFNWGPLWTHSTFAFESGNYHLLRAIKCARGVTQQIVRFVNINHSIRILQNHVYPDASDPVKIYCNEILNGKVQNAIKISNITYFGKGKHYNIDSITRDLNLSDTCTKVFLRITKNGCLYGSCNRPNVRRSNDSIVRLDDGRFIKIESFIVDTENGKEFTLGHLIHTTNCFNNVYKQFKKIILIEEDVITFSTTAIKNICVLLNVFGMLGICPLPNLLHY